MDGKFIGVTDGAGEFYESNLNQGVHTFRFEKDGYQTVQKTVKLTELTETLSISLKPLASFAASGPAHLLISVNVAGANVFLDGKKVDTTKEDGHASVYTTGGSHHLKITKRGYVAYEEVLSLQPDLTTTRNVILKKYEQAGTSNSDEKLIRTLLMVLIISLVIAAFITLKALRVIGKSVNRFDRYIIYEVIGRGGMATIYKAKDTTDESWVALKIMEDAFLNDKELINKFIREGSGIAQINEAYPSAPVVKVFRYGRENNKSYGRPYIAMELLKGPNLLTIIKQNKKYNLNFILQVIYQVSIALKAAHARGIYHRDVSPDNIILIKNDPSKPEIRLIDFGVARHEYVAAMTLDGSIAGKPAYMSPEQCRGEKVDARSDIYSLGIVFYTLLSGRPPFVSNNPLEVMHHHEKSPLPPLPNEIPLAIRAIVDKMLKKKKEERYQDISELIADLSSLMKEA